MALTTRRPTGKPAWPLILVEGPEKTGKSWLAAELAHSPQIGKTFWVDLGEGSADEYLDPNDPRHEIVVHDGTYTSILAAVAEAKNEAAQALASGAPPTLLVIDSMTALWELLSLTAEQKARIRTARKLKREIGADETVTIGTDLWNEANARHRKIMNILMTYPGVAVITARGKDVVKIAPDGRPVEGARDYRVEGQRNLAFDASIWIRLSREFPPTLYGVRHKRYGLRPGVDEPKTIPDLTLENLLFETLGYGTENVQVRDLVSPQITPSDLFEGQSQYVTVLEEAIRCAATEQELRSVHGSIKPAVESGNITREEAHRLYEYIQQRKKAIIEARQSVES